jgi:hypothetical protein
MPLTTAADAYAGAIPSASASATTQPAATLLRIACIRSSKSMLPAA